MAPDSYSARVRTIQQMVSRGFGASEAIDTPSEVAADFRFTVARSRRRRLEMDVQKTRERLLAEGE